MLGVCDFLGVHLSLMMMLKDALKSQQSLIEARAEDKEAGEPVATMLNFSTISVSTSSGKSKGDVTGRLNTERDSLFRFQKHASLPS